MFTSPKCTDAPIKSTQKMVLDNTSPPTLYARSAAVMKKRITHTYSSNAVEAEQRWSAVLDDTIDGATLQEILLQMACVG